MRAKHMLFRNHEQATRPAFILQSGRFRLSPPRSQCGWAVLGASAATAGSPEPLVHARLEPSRPARHGEACANNTRHVGQQSVRASTLAVVG
jgi:hypothetical protein